MHQATPEELVPVSVDNWYPVPMIAKTVETDSIPRIRDELKWRSDAVARLAGEEVRRNLKLREGLEKFFPEAQSEMIEKVIKSLPLISSRGDIPNISISPDEQWDDKGVWLDLEVNKAEFGPAEYRKLLSKNSSGFTPIKQEDGRVQLLPAVVARYPFKARGLYRGSIPKSKGTLGGEIIHKAKVTVGWVENADRLTKRLEVHADTETGWEWDAPTQYYLDRRLSNEKNRSKRANRRLADNMIKPLVNPVGAGEK